MPIFENIMVQFEKTKLDGVFIIKPSVFEDFRGEHIEIYNEKIYEECVNTRFIQDNISVSTKHVLRGIHGDDTTWKLISCLYGRFYLVVIDYNKYSKNFGKWQGFTISDKNRYQVLVPPKFGNGHLVLSDSAIFHYKQSMYYDPKSQFTIKWNDPKFNIWWPIKSPIISQRDEIGHIING